MRIILPLILIMAIVLWIIFQKVEKFRKYRVWLKIRWNASMKFFKHMYYDVIYLIRLTAFIKTLLYIGIVIAFLILIGLGLIYIWNEYFYYFFVKILHFNVSKIELPDMRTLFSRFNIFWILGAIGGSLLSVFIKPKLEKFADKVNAKPYMIYIFGSNTLVQKLINELIRLGLGPMVALFADRKYYWIEDLGKAVDVLILDSPDELRMPTIYDKITFKNALKVISLVDSPEDNQHIILNVRRNNPDVEIIVLSRNKPYILDLVGTSIQNITIIEDLDTISREIIRRLALGFIYAPVIESFVPEDYIGRTPRDLEEDFGGKIKVLGIKRGGRIINAIDIKFEEHDKLLLYLADENVLREFIHLIPVKTPEEALKEEAVKEEIMKEVSASEEVTEEQKKDLLEKLKKKDLDG